MLRQALVYFWQIHYPTPIKLTFVALSLLNIGLMISLAWNTWRSWFSIYLPFAAAASLLLATPLWNEGGEIALLIGTIGWAVALVPRDRRGFLFAAALATMFVAAIHVSAPPPWPRYPADQYYTRLYSTAVFFACACSSFLVPLFERRQIPWEHVLAIPWFGAVLFALVQRMNWEYFTVGIAAKLAWTACLILWILLNHHRNRAITDQSLPRGGVPSGTSLRFPSSFSRKDIELWTRALTLRPR